MNDCIEWPLYKKADGYGLAAKRGGRGMIAAHRRAWQDAYGDVPDGMSVLHRCDNPGCVNPEHLFLGTQRDNMADMVAKGRSARGSKSASAKLTEKDIPTIRRLHNEGETLNAIGRRYGVTRHAIWQIISGRTWRHA